MWNGGSSVTTARVPPTVAPSRYSTDTTAAPNPSARSRIPARESRLVPEIMPPPWMHCSAGTAVVAPTAVTNVLAGYT
jgi:hypothetical protein